MLMKSLFSDGMLERLYEGGMFACMTLADPEHAVPVTRALLAGGVKAIELTLRTTTSIESLRRIRAEVPEMLAGVGTVLRPEQVRDIVRAGGQFGVAPGLSEKVVKAAQDADLPFAPGITTPSEVERALDLGCREMKFFPAEPSGGVAYMQSMGAPYAHLGVRFLPLGGVNLRNMKDYLEEPSTLAVGGSWIVTRDVLRTENWTALTVAAGEAAAIVAEVRRGGALRVG